MKNKVSILFFLLSAMAGFSQAHLGSTFGDIKKMHPDNEFTIGYTTDGTMYAETFFDSGMFLYFFNQETKLSYFCSQVPTDNQWMNKLVQRYNAIYEMTSGKPLALAWG